MPNSCSGTRREIDLRKKYMEYDQHKVSHVMQNSYWDCGLACVAMILCGLNIKTCMEALGKQCTVESIWTIDLAFLLERYTTHFTYYTSYLGSRKEYQDETFYQANFDQDEVRVNQLFSSAKTSGVNVIRMILPLDDFKRFLYGKNFALLVLVNAQLLNCLLCNKVEHIHSYDYFGHYVVIIGYNPIDDVFIYRDPATLNSYCIIATKDLEKARQAKGTDHDWYFSDPIAVI